MGIKSDRIREIADEISELLEEAKDIAKTCEGLFYDHFYDHYKAYVFDQIEEHLNKKNPYNRDMEDLANDIEDKDEDEDE